MFAQTSNLSWPEVRSLASSFALTIENLTPDIYTEMLGIAEGSNLDILDIVALNCRSEIALGNFSDGCTSLGWQRSESEVLLAQNWDWTRRVKGNCVLMSIDQPGKPKIWMVTEAGIVGKIGFNSYSVGTTLNAIRAKAMDFSKLPIHVVLRLFLESTSAETAIAKLEKLGGIASCAHILLADPSGPRSLELSPKGNTFISPNDRGIVCHSNHFISNRYITESKDWLKGSPIRLERIRQLTKELDEGGKVVNGDVLREKVFSDLFNAPQAICCQEDPARPVETRSSTLFCIVMRFGGGDPIGEVVWGMPGSGEEGPVLSMPW